MKKIYLILIALSLTLLFMGCGNTNEGHRYSSLKYDKDAIESLGVDGQFGIFKIAPQNNLHLDLYDAKNNECIDFIYDYKVIDPYVYTIGKKGYTKLNYMDGDIIQSNNLDGFSEMDKEVFNNLK